MMKMNTFSKEVVFASNSYSNSSLPALCLFLQIKHHKQHIH